MSKPVYMTAEKLIGEAELSASETAKHLRFAAECLDPQDQALDSINRLQIVAFNLSEALGHLHRAMLQRANALDTRANQA